MTFELFKNLLDFNFFLFLLFASTQNVKRLNKVKKVLASQTKQIMKKRKKESQLPSEVDLWSGMTALALREEEDDRFGLRSRWTPWLLSNSSFAASIDSVNTPKVCEMK